MELKIVNKQNVFVDIVKLCLKSVLFLQKN